MEPFLDNKDTDKADRDSRTQRIERMRREKEQQQERREKIRKYLPFAAGALGVIIVIATAGALLLRKPKVNDTEQQVQTEESTQSVVMSSEVEETAEMMTSTAEIVPPSVYEFKTTSDIITISSENVISPNAILIDESTDMIIASKAAKERICPASMTKILTVLVAAEQIAEEDLDDIFTMTLEITDYAYVNDCSSVGFLDGEKVTVRDLFYGTVLPSGADAAVGLATYVAGSQEAFVDMMNEKLTELGLSDSAHFTNCVGLYDEKHYCTVYDMAVIMKAAMQNELCREIMSAHTYTTSKTAEHPDGIIISNWFLRRIEDKETGGEVLCAKTGYVVQSGSCAASFWISDNEVPYICVTAGSTSSWRCIYDHVEIYSRYAADEEQSGVSVSVEKTEEVNSI